LGPERDLRISGHPGNRRPLARGAAAHRGPFAVSQTGGLDRRERAGDPLCRRNLHAIREAPDNAAAGGLRRPARSRSGGRPRGVEETALQPSLLRRRGPQATHRPPSTG
jgi:hypothetical protein